MTKEQNAVVKRALTDVVPPQSFVGFDFMSTFGNRELEMMAEIIVSYCADCGTWDVPMFQFERLAKLADLVDAQIINGGINNRMCERGLCALEANGWLNNDGITQCFVDRLIESSDRWTKSSPLSRRVDAAVVAIQRSRS